MSSTGSGPPSGKRVGSILLAVLLVGSMIAPVATAGTASAATSTSTSASTQDSLSCASPMMRFTFPFSCGPAVADYEEIDVDREASLVETDVHTSGQGVYEGLDQRDLFYSNYLEDTETLASLEARDAIATSYENNLSATEADAKAAQAIDDYYAHHQHQLLEMMSADSAELYHLTNVTRQHSDVDDDFLHPWPMENQNGYATDYDNITGELKPANVSLVNGTTNSYEFIEIYSERSGYSGSVHNWINAYQQDTDNFHIRYDSNNYAVYDGGIQMLNVPESDLNSTAAYDFRPTAQLFYELETQSESVKNAYPSNVSEDLYAAMDAGDLSPNDVRGAEGTVRYLSGDATGGEALELALRHSLDIDHPDQMNTTFVVNADVKTDRVRVTNPDGSLEYEYNQINQTLEGILFATGFPNGTAETGVEYNVSDFEQPPSMLLGDGEKVFWEGTFTIESMTDADGNEVQSMNYSGPQYASYDADEYIAALEKATEERYEITGGPDEDEENDDSGGLDIGLPGLGALGLDGGGGLVGLGIIAVIALVVVGFVTDQIPALGRR